MGYLRRLFSKNLITSVVTRQAFLLTSGRFPALRVHCNTNACVVLWLSTFGELLQSHRFPVGTMFHRIACISVISKIFEKSLLRDLRKFSTKWLVSAYRHSFSALDIISPFTLHFFQWIGNQNARTFFPYYSDTFSSGDRQKLGILSSHGIQPSTIEFLQCFQIGNTSQNADVKTVEDGGGVATDLPHSNAIAASAF